MKQKKSGRHMLLFTDFQYSQETSGVRRSLWQSSHPGCETDAAKVSLAESNLQPSKKKWLYSVIYILCYIVVYLLISCYLRESVFNVFILFQTFLSG